MYRALEIISKVSDFIQKQLYKNSQKITSSNADVHFYDITNFYCETEEDDEITKTGILKEYRPSLIVEVVLFMNTKCDTISLLITFKRYS